MPTQPDPATAARCAGTPTVSVLDNRGLTVRAIRYQRLDAGDADERIERLAFSPSGLPLSATDARLDTPAFRFRCALSARVLATDSADAGSSRFLADIEGAPCWTRDAAAHVRRLSYDPIHRLLAVSDDGNDSERFGYGEEQAVAGANRCGRLLHHQHPAGLDTIASWSHHGLPLSEQYQFLDDAGTGLETAVFTTRFGYDATGSPVSLTDAACNRRRLRLNVAGQLAGSELLWAGAGNWLPVLLSIDYAADGQIVQEVAGNGLVSDYDYEPQSRRLNALTSTCAGQPLQAFRYDYDPVGNLLGCDDGVVTRRFHGNRATDGSQSFRYDALYQLSSATGREQAAGPQTAALPAALVPLSTDASILSPYTRSYDYDRAGNLTAIRHQGSQPYTLEMIVSAASNRALQQTGGLTPADVDAGFDAAGRLQGLAAGQPLQWDARGQLQATTLIARSGEADDAENYRYASAGQRRQKTLSTRTSGTTRTQRVRYLPGLELRETTQTPDGGSTTTVEMLHVLHLDSGGRQSARALHWSEGQPAGITNDGVRYSLSDPVGSMLLELDDAAAVIGWELYYPYGGTAAWSARSDSEADTRFVRYSGKERDASGLYAYGHRYYAPWLGRWISPDPAGTIDGLNLFCMVRNNPVSLRDRYGLKGTGYLYVPLVGEDTVDMVLARNVQRRMQGKSPYKVAFSTQQDRFQFLKLLGDKRV